MVMLAGWRSQGGQPEDYLAEGGAPAGVWSPVLRRG